jgi:WhiB family redox-sensing transcriptional regulator
MSAALGDPPLTPGQRARALLLADPSAPSREIARLAGCERQTVHRARRRLEAAGLIPARASHTPPAWRVRELPAMPAEMAGGLCVGHSEPDLWTSPELADQRRAKRICGRCDARSACFRWSLTLPSSTYGILAGLTRGQRLAIKRQRQARAS